MKYHVKILRESIKPNPGYGLPIVMYGRSHTTHHDDGSVTINRSVIPLREIGNPGPVVDHQKWLYDYEVTEVTCEGCGASFPWTELKDTTDYDYDGNAIGWEDVCPKCGEPECCDVEFEDITTALARTNPVR